MSTTGWHDLETGNHARRQHRLDEDKALWVPRDIRFQGYEYPDSNINAGVFLIARKAYTTVRRGGSSEYRCTLHILDMFSEQPTACTCVAAAQHLHAPLLAALHLEAAT